MAADEVAEQLAPYRKHRTTGQPWVVLKMAASLDGRTAAPDGTSRWITGEAARRDAHRLRARSDAVLVGAGTVRADDPALTVRLDDGVEHASSRCGSCSGQAPAGAKVQPGPRALGRPGRRAGPSWAVVACSSSWSRAGPRVAHDFHAAGLVDRYVLYLAPALFGGDDGRPIFAGPGAGTIGDVWKGRLVSIEQLGEDLRVEVAA